MLVELSNKFYTLIPHVVGMRPPPVINNEQLLKQKIAMVESLGDVAMATNLLRQASTGSESLLNPVDVHYEKLKCAFTPVEKDSTEFKLITDYAKNTHGHTHTQYKLEVLEAFDLDRDGETARFTDGGFDKTKNTQLLWHGSRLTNFVGIISQGLRIAPPEAPVTGQEQQQHTQKKKIKNQTKIGSYSLVVCLFVLCVRLHVRKGSLLRRYGVKVGKLSAKKKTAGHRRGGIVKNQLLR